MGWLGLCDGLNVAGRGVCSRCPRFVKSWAALVAKVGRWQRCLHGQQYGECKLMGMMSEFRDFVARGNVLDLAVGVIIGAAFGKVVTSLTEDLIMPVIGAATGGVDFSSKFIVLRTIPESYTGSLTDYAALKTGAAWRCWASARSSPRSSASC